MTEDEAETLVHLTPFAEETAQIAARMGVGQEALAEQVESGRLGAHLPYPAEGTRHYSMLYLHGSMNTRCFTRVWMQSWQHSTRNTRADYQAEWQQATYRIKVIPIDNSSRIGDNAHPVLHA